MHCSTMNDDGYAIVDTQCAQRVATPTDWRSLLASGGTGSIIRQLAGRCCYYIRRFELKLYQVMFLKVFDH